MNIVNVNIPADIPSKIIYDTVGKNNWSAVEIVRIQIGPCVKIVNDMLVSGFVMELKKKAKFPPQGISYGSINRQTELFIISEVNHSRITPLTEFPAKTEDYNDALSERTINKEILGDDPDNYVMIGYIKEHTADGFDVETCCIIVDTDGGYTGPSDSTKQSKLTTELLHTLTQNEEKRKTDRAIIANAVAKRLWKARGIEVVATSTISNRYGIVVENPQGNNSYLFYVGCTNCFLNKEGTLVRKDKPGNGWILFKGSDTIGSGFEWHNNFDNMMPHSFGSIINDETNNTPPPKNPGITYSQMNLGDLKKVYKKDLGQEIGLLYTGKWYLSEKSTSVLEYIRRLGFNDSWDKLRITSIMELSALPDPDHLKSETIQKVYGDRVVDFDIGMDNFLNFLESFVDIVHNEGIKDPHQIELLKQIFPTWRGTTKIGLPVPLLKLRPAGQLVVNHFRNLHLRSTESYDDSKYTVR